VSSKGGKPKGTGYEGLGLGEGEEEGTEFGSPIPHDTSLTLGKVQRGQGRARKGRGGQCLCPILSYLQLHDDQRLDMNCPRRSSPDIYPISFCTEHLLYSALRCSTSIFVLLLSYITLRPVSSNLSHPIPLSSRSILSCRTASHHLPSHFVMFRPSYPITPHPITPHPIPYHTIHPFKVTSSETPCLTASASWPWTGPAAQRERDGSSYLISTRCVSLCVSLNAIPFSRLLSSLFFSVLPFLFSSEIRGSSDDLFH
jgi:hypothetical protein